MQVNGENLHLSTHLPESSVLVFGRRFRYVLMVLCCHGDQTVGKDLP